jgi:dihydrofolate synthase/folylpolyglutamate synthase
MASLSAPLMAVDLAETSTALLASFGREQGHVFTISEAYLDLLGKLGNPHKKLPPTFHVAGTNGKGSTCAFLRAILEAAGARVHVYTSPHLVRFHERIRICGWLIGEEELVEILSTVRRFAAPGTISYFEAATAAAFTAFARHPADFVILEVGMGGRLDATNVIEKPLATLITRLSYDHCQYLGTTLTDIAREKAGIMKNGVPCFVQAQPETESVASLRKSAAEKGAPLKLGEVDWHLRLQKEGFRFEDKARVFDLPAPALVGMHQFENAGLAIASLCTLPKSVSREAIAEGLEKVEWPARLQPITKGALALLLSPKNELWLDGGHNDSAGSVLAKQAERWSEEKEKQPLQLIFGMLSTKDPRAFLKPLAPYIEQLSAITIPDDPLSFAGSQLAEIAREVGIKGVRVASDVSSALKEFSKEGEGRILICGSLYLAGHILNLNSDKNSAAP